jgi:HK97 family phage major capsid protein
VSTIEESPRLTQARSAHQDALQRMHDAADAYENLPAETPDADVEAASAVFDAAQDATERAKKELDRLERVAEARAAAPLPVEDPEKRAPARPNGTTKEPLTYTREAAYGDKRSYFVDLAKAQRNEDKGAIERIQRHGQEMLVERRDITRVDGAGGEFVPPVWLIDKYFDLARPARTAADLVTKLPLPGGTDSINIPRITTGAAVAIQASDNANVQETDMVTATVTAPVRTIAGQQDVAMQLLDQSPIAFDQVVFKSLTSDYAQKLDVQVLGGAGTSGTLLGLSATGSISTISYTDGTPTVPEFYSKAAGLLNTIQTARFLPPEAWLMHPRRWYWMLAASDTAGRPLVVPVGQGPNQSFNSVGTADDPKAEGFVGYFLGLPVYLDPSIITNNGAGTNEDIVYLGRFSDAMLFEGTPRTRVLFEVLSQTLTARFQLYNYVAFTAAGFPAGIGVMSGTGLVAPTF